MHRKTSRKASRFPTTLPLSSPELPAAPHLAAEARSRTARFLLPSNVARSHEHIRFQLENEASCNLFDLRFTDVSP
jgi:hypothetical protein